MQQGSPTPAAAAASGTAGGDDDDYRRSSPSASPPPPQRQTETTADDNDPAQLPGRIGTPVDGDSAASPDGGFLAGDGGAHPILVDSGDGRSRYPSISSPLAVPPRLHDPSVFGPVILSRSPSIVGPGSGVAAAAAAAGVPMTLNHRSSSPMAFSPGDSSPSASPRRVVSFRDEIFSEATADIGERDLGELDEDLDDDSPLPSRHQSRGRLASIQASSAPGDAERARLELERAAAREHMTRLQSALVASGQRLPVASATSSTADHYHPDDDLEMVTAVPLRASNSRLQPPVVIAPTSPDDEQQHHHHRAGARAVVSPSGSDHGSSSSSSSSATYPYDHTTVDLGGCGDPLVLAEAGLRDLAQKTLRWHAVARKSALSDLPIEVLRHTVDHFLSISQHYLLRLVCRRWNAMVTSNCVLWMRRVPNYLSHGYTSTTECNVFLHSMPSTALFARHYSRNSIGNFTVASSTASEDTAVLSREQSWTTESHLPSRYARPAQIQYCFQGCAYRTWRSLRLQKAISSIKRFHRQKDKYVGGVVACSVLYPPHAGIGTTAGLLLSMTLFAVWAGMFSDGWRSRLHPDALVITFLPLWFALTFLLAAAGMFVGSRRDVLSKLPSATLFTGGCATAVLVFVFSVLSERVNTNLEFRISPLGETSVNGTSLSYPRDWESLGPLAIDAIKLTTRGAMTTTTAGREGDETGSPMMFVYFLPFIVGMVTVTAQVAYGAWYDVRVVRRALSLFRLLDEYCGPVVPVKRLPRRLRPNGPLGGASSFHGGSFGGRNGAGMSQRAQQLLASLLPPTTDPIAAIDGGAVATSAAGGDQQVIPPLLGAEAAGGDGGDNAAAAGDGSDDDGNGAAQPSPAAGDDDDDDDEGNGNGDSDNNARGDDEGDEEGGGDGETAAGAASANGQPTGPPTYDAEPFEWFHCRHVICYLLALVGLVLIPLELEGWTGSASVSTYEFPNLGNATRHVPGVATISTGPGPGVAAAAFYVPDAPAARAVSPGALAAVVWVTSTNAESPASAPTRLLCTVSHGVRVSFLFFAASAALLIHRQVIGMLSSWRKVGRRLVPFTVSMAFVLAALCVTLCCCVVMAFVRVDDLPADGDPGAVESLLAMTLRQQTITTDAEASAPPPTSAPTPSGGSILTTAAPPTVTIRHLVRATLEVSCVPPHRFTIAELSILCIWLLSLLLAGIVNAGHDKSRYYDFKMVKYSTFFERVLGLDDSTTIGIERLLSAVRNSARGADAGLATVHEGGSTANGAGVSDRGSSVNRNLSASARSSFVLRRARYI